jgi:hypothetical protein
MKPAPDHDEAGLLLETEAGRRFLFVAHIDRFGSLAVHTVYRLNGRERTELDYYGDAIAEIAKDERRPLGDVLRVVNTALCEYVAANAEADATRRGRQ